MKAYADLHIHSCYAIASSRNMLPAPLLAACRKKGINVLGTGDILHPGWEALWREALPLAGEICVVPTTEVEDRDRVHHLVLLGDLSAVQELREAFSLSSRDLLTGGRPHVRLSGEEIAGAVHRAGGLIGPAHAFTPWTSLYASHETVASCYGTEPIDLLELGLSADSEYGSAIPDLEGVPFLTNSDAHSPDPSRIGREFTCLDLREANPAGVLEAVAEGKILFNAGFFPEEGKYNRTACTRCYTQYSLGEAVELSWKCPVDKGRIKKGVRDRAGELATGRKTPRPPYYHTLPLGEIIRVVLSCSSPHTRKARSLYESCLSLGGTEIAVLLEVPVTRIAAVDSRLAQAIESLRSGTVILHPGGGGKYGSFSLFPGL